MESYSRWAAKSDNAPPESYPDDNPKTAKGRKKVPLRLLPTAALRAWAWVQKHGADKYGEWNWRKHRVSRSVYYEAALRHLTQMWDGEDADAESGQPHEAHVMACMAIILDAKTSGTLNDDRPEKKANDDNSN